VKKYNRARQAIDENMAHVRCLLDPKATNTHTLSQVLKYLLFFHDNSGFTNAHQYYVIRTLPVLLLSLIFVYVIISVLVFLSFRNQIVVSVWQLIPIFVTVIPVPINHEHRECSVI
jgi:hypothetical protein